MGRYRAPQKLGSKYITAEGKVKLDDEFAYLWKVKRPRVTRAVTEAAAEGDRSENAEYIYRKKQLREIDRRVRYLRKRLDDIVVVDSIPGNQDTVYFGAWVRLEDERGDVLEYRIVGPDEIDNKPGYISMDSPVGQALLRKSVHDDIAVKLPEREAVYTILGVKYEPFTDHER